MALDLCYLTKNDRLDFRFAPADWQLLSVMARTHPADLEVICGVDDFGVGREVSTVALRSSVETVLAQLELQGNTLPYLYGYKFVGGMWNGNSGSGRTCGIRLGGDGYYYAIEGGLGRCVLIKSEIGPDGRGRHIGERDIRNVKSIQTDNLGEIRIYRKRKATRLRSLLEQLREFLSRTTEKTVTKVLG
jgi:hypothetical protein